jgi:hypothetical protein
MHEQFHAEDDGDDQPEAVAAEVQMARAIQEGFEDEWTGKLPT